MRAKLAGYKQPAAGDVRVSMQLCPKATKKQTGKAPRCIDIDNALKVALDALQGVCYVNDAQIVELYIEKGDPVEGGQLNVIVWEIES